MLYPLSYGGKIVDYQRLVLAEFRRGLWDSHTPIQVSLQAVSHALSKCLEGCRPHLDRQSTSLIDRHGRWRLSPAYDVIYARNPAGQWTHQHQMSINGKRDHFSLADLIEVGEAIRIPNPPRVLAQVIDSVIQWPRFASGAGVKKAYAQKIAGHHRLNMPPV